METPVSNSQEAGFTSPNVWVELESELAVFAKITDESKLLEADEIFYQEQPEAKLKSGSKARCRKEVMLDRSLKKMNGNISYVFTFKVQEEGTEENPLSIKKENNCLVNEEFYNNWLKVSDYCQKKIRFGFNAKSAQIKVESHGETQTVEVPDVKYEVDVFLDQDNKTSNVCKIDVEVDKVLNYLKEHHPEITDAVLKVDFLWLPFGPTDLIYPRQATDQQRSYLDEVYKNLINHPIPKVAAPE